MASRKFEPKYDAAGDGVRQPGSAWKPIVYASAFDTKQPDAGQPPPRHRERSSGASWTPRDADQLDRGPVLVRKALQYSLNMPAIRALQRGRAPTRSPTGRRSSGSASRAATRLFLQAGLAGALGTVEVTPLDLTSAYGAIANGGARVPPRMILEIRDRDGQGRSTRRRRSRRRPRPSARRPPSSSPTSSRATPTRSRTRSGRRSSRSATGRPDSTGPSPRRPGPRTTPGTSRRTGSSRPPKDPSAPGHRDRALDGQQRPLEPALARARDLADRRRAAVARLRPRPDEQAAGRRASSARRASSRRGSTRGPAASPGPGRGDTISEWFIGGTQPGAKNAVDPPGLLYTASCGGWRVDPVKAELGPRVLGRRRRGLARPGAARASASAASSARGPPTSGAGPAGAARCSGAARRHRSRRTPSRARAPATARPATAAIRAGPASRPRLRRVPRPGREPAMTIEPGLGRSVVRGAGLAIGVALVALVILVGRRRDPGPRPDVHRGHPRVRPPADHRLAARPPPDRSRPDDPHRLRAVPRDRRRPGRRRRAGRARARRSGSLASVPSTLDQARTWAATLEPAAVSRTVTALIDEMAARSVRGAGVAQPDQVLAVGLTVAQTIMVAADAPDRRLLLADRARPAPALHPRLRPARAPPRQPPGAGTRPRAASAAGSGAS